MGKARTGVVAAYLAVALGFAAVVPIFEAPDEPGQLRNVLTLVEERRLPDASPVVYAGDHHAVFEGHQPPLYIGDRIAAHQG